MDLTLNNLQRLICHKTKPTNQQTWHFDVFCDLSECFYFLTPQILLYLHQILDSWQRKTNTIYCGQPSWVSFTILCFIQQSFILSHVSFYSGLPSYLLRSTRTLNSIQICTSAGVLGIQITRSFYNLFPQHWLISYFPIQYDGCQAWIANYC